MMASRLHCISLYDTFIQWWEMKFLKFFIRHFVRYEDYFLFIFWNKFWKNQYFWSTAPYDGVDRKHFCWLTIWYIFCLQKLFGQQCSTLCYLFRTHEKLVFFHTICSKWDILQIILLRKTTKNVKKQFIYVWFSLPFLFCTPIIEWHFFYN